MTKTTLTQTRPHIQNKKQFIVSFIFFFLNKHVERLQLFAKKKKIRIERFIIVRASDRNIFKRGCRIATGFMLQQFNLKETTATNVKQCGRKTENVC